MTRLLLVVSLCFISALYVFSETAIKYDELGRIEVQSGESQTRVRFLGYLNSFLVIERIEIFNKLVDGNNLTCLSFFSGVLKNANKSIVGKKAVQLFDIKGSDFRKDSQYFYKDAEGIHEIPIGSVSTWRTYITNLYLNSSISNEDLNSLIGSIE